MSRITSEADRQQARFNLLTPAEVAARLDNVSADTVRHWCAGGWLRHVDIRRPGARTATYLVEWGAVDAGPDGAGFRTDGAAYTLEARSVPQAAAYGMAVRRLDPTRVRAATGVRG